MCVRLQRDSYVLLYLRVYWGWRVCCSTHVTPRVHRYAWRWLVKSKHVAVNSNLYVVLTEIYGKLNIYNQFLFLPSEIILYVLYDFYKKKKNKRPHFRIVHGYFDYKIVSIRVFKTGVSNFLGGVRQKATTIFAGHMFKNHNKWCTWLPEFLCNFYDICTVYKCGHSWNSSDLTAVNK